MAVMRCTGIVVVALVLGAGCKDKNLDATDKKAEGESCQPPATNTDPSPCKDGLACEPAGNPGGDQYVCAVPVDIEGLVYDALSQDPIKGALVAALDESGSPVSDVAVTDADGKYTLAVSARRDQNGDLTDALKWTLFVSAQDYQPFPAGIRPAIPVNAADAMDMNVDSHTAHVIDNASTSVALIPLPAGQQTGVTVKGHVGGEHPEGTLVVAEGGSAVPYTIADASGDYTLFNVPTKGTTVRGYRRGLDVKAVTQDFAKDTDGVDLALVTETEGDLASVSGSVNIVNAAGGSQTSVVLVPKSLFDATLERGPVPFGMRAPDPPLAPNVTSGFSIPGIPPGTYEVLAAFENDDLVRDPDASIAGTAIQEITVSGSGQVAVPDAFKVTEALAVMSPGADAPEYVPDTPTFVWADDSSEDHYELVVYDALGNKTWENTSIPAVNGSSSVSVKYGGKALQDGMYYQFRATSFRDTPQASTAISRTEDLRGVFVFGSAPVGM